MFKSAKNVSKKLKLFVLYWRRIVFCQESLQSAPFQKLRANICGGFLADQWILYDFDHNDKGEYLSEFDWYRSRYINEPFDFLLNNKIAAAEIFEAVREVPESYMIKNKGFLTSFDSEHMGTKRPSTC